MDSKKMFCYQCQETAKGTGCTLQGVCGKKPETSARMDQLIYLLKGIAIVNKILRDKGSADHDASLFIVDGLFTTITNANFDNKMLDEYLDKAVEIKNILIGTAKKHGIELPPLPEVSYHPTPEEYGKLTIVEDGGNLDEEFWGSTKLPWINHRHE